MQSDTNIRRCKAGDEAALALVGQATFLQTFAGVLAGDAIVAHCADAHGPARYRAWLADPACALWLVEAEPGRAPVGYMWVSPADLPLPDATPDDLEIKRIYLLDRWRGGGLGGQLVALAKAHAAERGARCWGSMRTTPPRSASTSAPASRRWARAGSKWAARTTTTPSWALRSHRPPPTP